VRWRTAQAQAQEWEWLARGAWAAPNCMKSCFGTYKQKKGLHLEIEFTKN
jgi:hypothetical protein